ncbi:hypothetical protein ACHAXR_008618 [Thalassiosira sp. AJA248-18]
MSGDDPQPTAGTTAAAATATANLEKPVLQKNIDGDYAIKVKSEFVLSERPSCLTPPEPPTAAADEGNKDDRNDNDGDNNQKSKRSKNNRGQNKKRPRDSKIAYAEKACLAVVRGESCPFQKSERGCRYNHDLKEMMANRPPDITEGEGGAAWLKDGCPFWNIKGLMCRLGASHVNMSTGQNIRRTIDESGKDAAICISTPSSSDTKATATNVVKAEDEEVPPKKPDPGTLLSHQSEIMNVLSKETQIKLRKKKYPFVCKRHFELQKSKTSKPPVVVTEAAKTTTTKPALQLKERKLIDFRDKVYIAPLTTVGNLPFRRIMKHYGADITCGEMALADQLLSGKPSEWALLKRHPCEDVFGVQIAAGHADQYTRVAEVLANEDKMDIDFVDLNLGCPIDLVCEKGAGASLMLREKKLRGSLEGMLNVLQCPVTIKMRTGWNEAQPIAHQLVPKIQSWGIDGIGAFMIHGRSRLQRYSRLAKWDYITQVASSQSPDLQQIPLIGNGDIFSYTDYEEKILAQVNKEEVGDGGNKNNLLPTAMLGRGALIKPWLPTEIKERRHWDISATERLDMLKDFVRFGLEHWGSDQQGVNHTRRFLLEWLSFLHRYVPVGLMEVLPQQMNHRPPNNMCGRSDLETMMLSKNCADWIKISEMLLGPVPEGFLFEPKHKANSYTKA